MDGQTGRAYLARREDSERLEEAHQIEFLLIGETDGEAPIVEIHHVEQAWGRTVVEVRGARSQSTQHGHFALADIKSESGNSRHARVIGNEGGRRDDLLKTVSGFVSA
jgi:hypothetical protein